MTTTRLFKISLAFRLALSALGPAKAAPLPTVTLVENGRPNGVILLAAEGDKDEDLAARELQEYVQKISGAALEIRRIAPADAANVAAGIATQKQVAIQLGQTAATPSVLDNLRAKGTDPDSFVVRVEPGAVKVAGLSPEGTLFGTYEMLEQLGVRWFMPGDIGTVIPRSKTVSLPRQETIQVPSFTGRWHGGSAFPEWARHVRMGGPSAPPAHGIPGTSQKEFANHPEWFALVDGKRSPKAKQLCISNPEVLQRTIAATREYFRKRPGAMWIGMGPNDGGGFCECEVCRAHDGGDWDPFVNERSLTDRYIWFFNQVLDGIKDEFPDKKLSFYSYHTYMRPPVKIKPDPRIVPQLAPITLCRVHGMNNSVCPERSYYKFLIEGWNKVLPVIYDRGYWFNLADPGFPFSEVHKMRDEIPAAHAYGIKGWRVETVNHWASETPSLYIAARLMWNHEADVDALLRDFAEKFFGPARQPMAQYLALMDAALRDTDHHTGSAFDMPLFYPHTLRDEARKYLESAKQQAGEGDYGKRVAIFGASFDYLEAFLSMLEHRDAYEFAAAKADLDRLDTMQKTLIAHDPPLINARVAPGYLKRFFRQPVEQGFARTTGGNELAAAFKDEWSFQIDPQKVGEDIGLWKADARGNNWQTIRTFSHSWSDQGLRTYKGEAWYRQEIEIPARFKGKRLFLWFGGVDEKAKVWLNGQLIGISHGGAFLPFEMDATPVALPGARNVVTVRLINENVDELGTGGITAPAFFYAPAAGQNAELSNVRELQPTFP